MDKKNLTLFDYMYASPYGSMHSQLKLSEEEFREYFVPTCSFNDMSIKLDEFFRLCRKATPSYICLHGYAGTGKTTFLHWFLKEKSLQTKNYNKLIFNFIDEDTPANEELKGIPIFDTYFRDLISKLFDTDYREEMKRLFSDLKSNLHVLGKAFSQYFKSEIENIYQSLITDNGKTKIIKIIDSANFKDLLVLFLLLYCKNHNIMSKLSGAFEFIPSNIDDSEKESLPLLLVFDNIDHMEIESNNHNFPRQIKDVINSVRSINSTYPIISCIFCLRDANFALANKALKEVIQKYDFPFYPSELDKIFEQRCKIANSAIVDDRKNLLDYFFIIDNEYTKDHFIPLFNFNYRKLIEFVEQFNVNGHLDIIKKLPNLWNDKIVVRGIIYYLIIKHIRNNDYLKQTILSDDINVPNIARVDNGEMNAARIILTLIHNRSEFYITNGEVGYDEPVPLYDLYKSYKEIFKYDTDGTYFFQCMSAMFLCHNNNFCHLITFIDKEIFKNEENFEEELKHLRTINENESDSYKSELALNRIKIQINPSGFIYLNEIMRHYEFFSIKAGNKEPLYTYLNLDVKKDKIIPVFFKNIEKTYQKTKRCIDSLKQFVKHFPGGVDGFERSEYCFKLFEPDETNPDDDKENPRLYLMRIIDTHINYIDNFRAYILENNIFKNMYITLRRDDMPSERHFMEMVNSKIVDYLEKYVEMLNDISEKKDLYDFFLRNIQKIRTTPIMDKKGNYRYISINTYRQKNYGEKICKQL
jgi:GTPase SAR1 family protein